jgi:predicted transcriptional regulator
MSTLVKDAQLNARVPEDILEKIDRVAKASDRKRSWVVLRALSLYLDEGEGADIIQEFRGLEEVRRGEGVPLSEAVRRLEAVAAHAAKKQAAGE